jgi:hypothetical protein
MYESRWLVKSYVNSPEKAAALEAYKKMWNRQLSSTHSKFRKNKTGKT